MQARKPASLSTLRVLSFLALVFGLLATSAHAGPAFPEFVDPNPSANNGFGTHVVPLSTGNVVITSPKADIGGTDTGAVYLFNGATGALISTLTGSTANDQVGVSGVTALTNGNYVVSSPAWNNGAVSGAGAATWGNGTTGISGVVSAANSLVGSKASDFVGTGITALTNGNYVVASGNWANGAVSGAGAATWGNGITGISGPVTTANSLVGSKAYDTVGTGITALTNGNYVVASASWANGAVISAGAVTWGNGTTGISGVVSATNSLVGSAVNDQVGSKGVTALTNGNYVVLTSNWANGAVISAGAVTWGNGATGISGVVSAANSLVGSTANDQVGNPGVTALTNGNYVVRSGSWDNGAVTDAGAVTWGNGTTGISGVVSAANSLVGSKASDVVGTGITALTNGNYVVLSSNWDNGAVANAGAATWGNGTTGISGPVTTANSLVGSTANDQVGAIGVTALTNGNYVVRSNRWANGAATVAGAVTWGNGTTGISGVVSAANSLVGSTANDFVGGNGVTALTNGNYVVRSSNWANGVVANAGAATWGNGTTGISGPVTTANSLVGSTISDQVGAIGVTALTNGNYVVVSRSWDNGALTNVGAATWGNGTTGTSGPVTTANSLVGSTANDQVGNSGVTALTNGNYVVRSSIWDNGAVANAGAVTWGNGTTGSSGVVGAANSLVGLVADAGPQTPVLDNVNNHFIVPFLAEGKVRVGSQGTLPTPTITSVSPAVGGHLGGAVITITGTSFTGATAVTIGGVAVTSFTVSPSGTTITAVAGAGTAGVRDVVVTTGSGPGTGTGLFTVVNTPVADALAVTTLEDKGKVFTVTATDADPGSALAYQVATQPSHGTLIGSGPTFIYVPFVNYNGADSFTFTAHDGQVRSAPATVSLTVTPVAEPATSGPAFSQFVDPNPSANNGFGTTIVPLNTGNVVITSPQADVGALDTGSVYLFSGATGALISTLSGSTARDNVGRGGVTALPSGNYVVRSNTWINGAAISAGAVTWCSGTSGLEGTVSAANSLIGSNTYDGVGNGGITVLTNGNYVVSSPLWKNGSAAYAGAATWGSGTTGISGPVSALNSLVGKEANSYAAGSIVALANGNYVVASSNWQTATVQNLGAVTWGNGTVGIQGEISASNSLVGTNANDSVGGRSVTPLTNGNYVVSSTQWKNGTATNAGAVTWGNGTTGIMGEVSSANSLVGSSASDYVGETVTALTNGNYVVGSPAWKNGTITGAGAATWGNGTTGIRGPVSAANSLVGSTGGDGVGRIITALTNGNYVVSSYSWTASASQTTVGAVTWGDGNTGISGPVTTVNSLVGSQSIDYVGTGGVRALANGNYVVSSPNWKNGAASNAGAVTWGNGATGAPRGAVSTGNSLVGTAANESIGNVSNIPQVTALSNGNYVVGSSGWNANTGAATWADGGAGLTGQVTTANSLTGMGGLDPFAVLPLAQGNYVVVAQKSLSRKGAVTWASGTGTTAGTLSAANSLVGAAAEDFVGGVSNVATTLPLPNGNYVVTSGQASSFRGIVSLGNGNAGIKGLVGSTGAPLERVGSVTGFYGIPGVTAAVSDPINNTFINTWNKEGIVLIGSQENGFAPPAPAIASLTPSSGSTAGGTELVIKGQNFTGATSVTLDGTPVVAFTVDNATQITLTTPVHAVGAVAVVVTTGVGSSNADKLFTFRAPVAEIAMEQSVGSDLASGSTFDFGTVNTVGSMSYTFTVKNTGDLALALSGSPNPVTVGGANAADFSVTAQPSATVAVNGGSTTFTVRFKPSGTGAKTASLSIPNNDATGSEAPFVLNLSGSGTTTAVAMTATTALGGLLGDTGFTIGQQGTTANANNWPTGNGPGSATDNNAATAFRLSKTAGAGLIVNLGAAARPANRLSLTTAADNADCDPTAYAIYGSPTVLSGVANTLIPINTLTLVGSGVVTLPAKRSSGPVTLAFENDTPFAAYVVVFPGVKNASGGSTQIAEVALHQAALGTAPELVLEQPADTEITSGSTQDLGFITVGNTVTRSFTLRNAGDKALAILGNVTLGGLNAGEFSITQQPALSISTGGSTTFTVSHTPTVGSQKTAVLSILSDDADEATTTVNLKSAPVFEVIMDTAKAFAGVKSGATFTVGQGTDNGSPVSGGENLWRNGEGPDLAVDGNLSNAAHKWVHYKDGNVGIIMSPTSAMGAVAMTQLQLWTANDQEGRDPATYELYGLSTAATNGAANTAYPVGTLISSGPLSLPTIRNSGPTNITIAPTTVAYPSFLLVFTTTKTNTNGAEDDRTQIAEIKFTGQALASSEIEVERITTTSPTPVVDNSTLVDFGTLATDSFNEISFTIRNTGLGNLTGLTTSVTGTNASSFTVTASPTAPVLPEGSTTFTVKFAPLAAAVLNATLQIASNDADEAPFDILLRGTGVPPADFEIDTLTAPGEIRIRDNTNHFGTLTLEEPSTGNLRFDSQGKSFRVNAPTGAVVMNSSPVLNLTGITRIVVNTGAQDDLILVNAFSSQLPSLSLSGGTGNDVVQFNGSVTFQPNASLDVDLQNDDATPGNDSIVFANNAIVTLSGTGSATLKASQSITMNANTVLTTVNGAILMEANQQTVATTSGAIGIGLAGGSVESTGSGNVTLKGKGGVQPKSISVGVNLTTPASVRANTGAIIVEGRAQSGAYLADGVSVNAGSSIATTSGPITLSGWGGSGGTAQGVYVGASVLAGGTGSLNITGTGGSFSSAATGVYLAAPMSTAGGALTISGTSSAANNPGVVQFATVTGGLNANVSITGLATGLNSAGILSPNRLVQTSGTGTILLRGEAQGSGDGIVLPTIVAENGNITVEGIGKNAVAGVNGNYAYIQPSGTSAVSITGSISSGTGAGVQLSAGRVVTAGSISLTGTGGSSGSSANGVWLRNQASLTSAGAGSTVTLNGTAGSSTGPSCRGVELTEGSRATTYAGDISILGNGGNNCTADSVGVSLYQSTAVQSSGTGNISITGNSGTNTNAFLAGVWIRSGIVSTRAGDINITGSISTLSTDPTSTGIAVDVPGRVSAGGTGDVFLTSDSMRLQGLVDAGDDDITLRPRTAGTPVELGRNTVNDEITGPLKLGLSVAELATCWAAVQKIGDATSGPVTVTGILSPYNAPRMEVAQPVTFTSTGGFYSDMLDTTTGCERMVVNGTVTIQSGAVFDLLGRRSRVIYVVRSNSNAPFTLPPPTSAFQPVSTAAFAVIDSTGGVTGDFLAKPESTAVSLTYIDPKMGITYMGGADSKDVVLFAAPALAFVGNKLEIANDDSTPRTADFTDFGIVSPNGNGFIERTFNLTNIGLLPMTFSDVSVTGDFSVSLQPTGSPLAARTVTAVTVKFDPTEIGLRTGTLTFTSSGLGTPTYSIAIAGTGGNAAPTDIALSESSVLENLPAGTQIGTLSSTDIDQGDGYTYSIESVDNTLFQIVGDKLQLTGPADFETLAKYSLRIRTTDDGSPAKSFEKDFTITIVDANDAPTEIALAEPLTRLPEGTSTASATSIGSLSFRDVDTNPEFFSGNAYSISGADAASFEIVDTSILKLKSGLILDTETKPSYSITVSVADPGAPQTVNPSVAYTLTIENVAEAPAGTDKTIAIDEDTTYTITAADWGFTDPLDEPDNALKRVKITTLPSLGELKVNGDAAVVGQFIDMQPGVAGVRWVKPDYNGSASPPSNIGVMAISGDGAYELVGQSRGSLSIYNGTAWARALEDASRSWTGVTLSSTGQFMSACTREGKVFTSTDFGVTWAESVTGFVHQFRGIASSDDGSLMVTAADEGILIRRDGTWVQATLPFTDTSSGWGGVTCSAEGDYIVAVDTYILGRMVRSEDKGITWTEVVLPGSRSWLGAIASSGSGANVVAASSGGVWISSDFAATWLAPVSGQTPSGKGVAVSADGQILLVVDNSYAAVSKDGGVTWRNRAFGTRGFVTAAMTANGRYMTTSSTGRIGGILVSRGMPDGVTYTAPIDAAGTPYASFTFQVEDDGLLGLGEAEILDLSPNTLTFNARITNRYPTDIALSSDFIPNGAVMNYEIGSFTSTDPDAGQTFSYSLATGSGDADNATFGLSAGKLLFNGTLANIKVKPSYSIRIRSTDSGTPEKSFEETFTLRVGYPVPEIEVLNRLTLNRLTGLYEHTVRVHNRYSLPMAGFRLTNTNLLPSVQMWNRTHAYLPIIESRTALVGNGSRDVLVSYYSRERDITTWVPLYSVDNLTDPDVPSLPGDMSGLWHGLASRSAVPIFTPNPNVGARLEVNVGAAGLLSGKVTEGKTVKPFTARISGYINLGDALGGLLQSQMLQANLNVPIPGGDVGALLAPYALTVIKGKTEEQDVYLAVIFIPEVNLTLGIMGGPEVADVVGGLIDSLGGDNDVNANIAELDDGGSESLLNLPFSIFLGWRNIWGMPIQELGHAAASSVPAPVLTYQPTSYLARHHFAMAPTELPDLGGIIPLANVQPSPQPEGYSFGTMVPLNVAKKRGDYTVAGRLADGSSFTCASFYGQYGQCLVHQSLYDHRGSLLGLLLIIPGEDAPLDNDLYGILTWMKPGPVGSAKPARNYGRGFSLFMTAQGGTYTPPAKGRIVMGLPPTAIGVANALMTFEGAGLPASITQALRFASAAPTSLVNRVSVTLPNRNAVRITSFSAATGLTTGSMTTAAVPKRAATFQALIVPTPSESLLDIVPANVGPAPLREQVGYGYFLLPQAPVAPQTTATSPILSGAVYLTPNVR